MPTGVTTQEQERMNRMFRKETLMNNENDTVTHVINILHRTVKELQETTVRIIVRTKNSTCLIEWFDGGRALR